MVSEPDSRFADSNGMVAAPAVDVATEMVNMLMAQFEFAAATKIVKAGDEMQRTAINLIA